MQIAIGTQIGYQGGAGGKAGVFGDLLRDEFAVDRAQGSVAGAPAAPGPGYIDVVTDTNADISISSDALLIPSGPSVVWYNPVSRAAGRILYMLADTFAKNNVGWDENQTGNATSGHALQVDASNNIRAYDDNNFTVVGTYAGETAMVQILRPAGAFYLLERTHWEIVFIGDAEAGNPMFPAIATTAVGAIAVSELLVPALRWSPIPLLSDGFSTGAASDGLGHIEGITDAPVGQGGDGVAWIDGTWSVADGDLINTPVEGSELTTDGALELWNNPTALTNWSKSLAGTSTVNRESSDVHAGTYACRLDVDASNSNTAIYQGGTFTAGAVYRMTFYAKASTTGKTISVRGADNVLIATFATLTTAYAKYTLITRGNGVSAFGPLISRGSAASSSIYIDDISVKLLPLADLFKAFDAGVADIYLVVNITIVPGEWAGVFINLDSETTPANVVVAYYDGTTMRIDKRVGGTVTNLYTGAATNVDGARMSIRRSGNLVNVYYNKTAVGSTLTISDAGIVSNTLHGVFSSSSGNLFQRIRAWATGSGGEYDAVLGAL